MINGKTNYEKLIAIDIKDEVSFSEPKEKDSFERKDAKKNMMKYASLITLTVQNAALSITMRASRTQKELFIASTAVIMAEIIKLISCLVMLRTDEGSLRRVLMSIKCHIFDNPTETMKVAVPSLVYYVQNNLLYVGATHLDAATSQVTYQLKILTTAIFSVFLLKKRLILFQWLSLLLLFIGVALVQLVQISKPKHQNATTSLSSSSDSHEQNPLIGFLAILAACILSGFAGVYFEKILKSTSEVSLWIRNLQLTAISIPFGFIQVFLSDFDIISQKGFFYGYSALTWTVILLQAQGGLLVAVVVKYADNILKGFATSFAIVLSCVISVYLFDFQVTMQFVVGTAFVIISIFLYSKPSTSSSATKLSESLRKT